MSKSPPTVLRGILKKTPKTSKKNKQTVFFGSKCTMIFTADLSNCDDCLYPTKTPRSYPHAVVAIPPSSALKNELAVQAHKNAKKCEEETVTEACLVLLQNLHKHDRPTWNTTLWEAVEEEDLEN